jgi:hypothetical protein
MDEAQFREEVREEVCKDFVRASRAMADAHRLFHGSNGWNRCELDPCHSVCVLLGDVAALLMADEIPEPAA